MYARSPQADARVPRYVALFYHLPNLFQANIGLSPDSNTMHPDWTPVYIYPIILQLFAHMSTRVIVSPELCGG